MELCKYKHIFGKEREGVHSIRVMDVAAVDVVLTIMGAVVLARVFHWNVGWTLLGVFVLGVIMHRIFCVNTKINEMIFGIV